MVTRERKEATDVSRKFCAVRVRSTESYLLTSYILYSGKNCCDCDHFDDYLEG